MRIVSRQISGVAMALVVAMGLCTLAAGSAAADEGAIKYRQAVMKSLGGTMGAIAGIVKGQVPYKDDLPGHAHALAELAKISAHIFPAESDMMAGETKAKDEIWSQQAEFEKALMVFQTETAEFAKVAEGGDMAAIGAQFGKVGGTCGGCHKQFRAK